MEDTNALTAERFERTVKASLTGATVLSAQLMSAHRVPSVIEQAKGLRDQHRPATIRHQVTVSLEPASRRQQIGRAHV